MHQRTQFSKFMECSLWRLGVRKVPVTNPPAAELIHDCDDRFLTDDVCNYRVRGSMSMRTDTRGDPVRRTFIGDKQMYLSMKEQRQTKSTVSLSHKPLAIRR